MEPWLQLPRGLKSSNPLPTTQGEQPAQPMVFLCCPSLTMLRC